MRCVAQLHSGRSRSRGYVLVMVLALLVVSASLLVGVGRAATRRAQAAGEARRDLQRKWGAVSCRMAVLPHVDQLLTIQEALRRKPMPVAGSTVVLGGRVFEIRIADEQAKANVNAILAASDVPRAETQLRTALAGSGLINHIKLRATQGPVLAVVTTQASTARVGAHVSGLGQVFDGVEPAQLIRPMPGARESAVDLLTCWGNGAVNVRRAGPTAMTLAGGRLVGGVRISRLVDARNAVFERAGADAAGESAGAVDRLRNEMRSAVTESLKSGGNFGLTERSTCHSIWIIVRGGRKDEYHLAVLDRSNDSRPLVYTHAW